MKVPFLDLGRQHAPLTEELDAGFRRVLRSGDFILGKEVESFEKAFAEHLGAPYAAGVGSGTEALHLSLRALGIGPGDEVIIPSLTFAATALAVLHAGAEPVPADVDPDTGLLDLASAAKAVTRRTRAVIPVHLYGRMLDMDALMDFAVRRHLAVIEDACQAHGARFHGKAAGTFGRVGCFSFYPSKNLGALGDGGLVVTSDSTLRDIIVKLRNYGQKVKYHHEGIGYNSRLDGLQAAMLRLKLKHLETWNLRRRRNARLYHRALKGLPVVLPPEPPEDSQHVYPLFVIRSPHRDRLRDHLAKCGVGTGIHYPIPMHRMEALSKCGRVRLPASERFCGEVLSLPMFPELTAEEIRHVARSIESFRP